MIKYLYYTSKDESNIVIPRDPEELKLLKETVFEDDAKKIVADLIKRNASGVIHRGLYLNFKLGLFGLVQIPENAVELNYKSYIKLLNIFEIPEAEPNDIEAIEIDDDDAYSDKVYSSEKVSELIETEKARIRKLESYFNSDKLLEDKLPANVVKTSASGKIDSSKIDLSSVDSKIKSLEAYFVQNKLKADKLPSEVVKTESNGKIKNSLIDFPKPAKKIIKDLVKGDLKSKAYWFNTVADGFYKVKAEGYTNSGGALVKGAFVRVQTFVSESSDNQKTKLIEIFKTDGSVKFFVVTDASGNLDSIPA